MNTEPLPLRDIHLPDPLSWWPPALGWWIVAMIPTLLLLVWWLYRHWLKRHRIRKAALLELNQLAQTFALHQDVPQFTSELSALLRRVCLMRHPRSQVASLAGEAWLQFLDQGLPSPSFSKGPGRVLITAPFQRHSAVNVNDLIAVCRQWLQALPSEKDFNHS
ncbi:MAG: DUF4381 domain-containing protein [Magnetococcales bacterium]|nr:DUF4381 domain-containing protein [Magnetococcales bacterium]MBF0438792.1 DUF4381 domain-containing protein [Magnetococcales bacterium]